MKSKIIRKAFKWIGYALSAIVTLAILAGVVGYIYLRGSLPDVDGTVKVSNLHLPVQIIRDVDGVAHIYAENKIEGYYGLGYAHAQDRLWQLELQRRTGQGRLAEIFGPAAFSTDNFMRTLGIHRSAKSSWESCEPETRQVVDAYVAGINAYIKEHSEASFQPEFTLLRVSPELWTGSDVLMMTKLMSWNLDGINYLTELLRANLSGAMALDQAQQLMPGYSDDASAPLQAQSANGQWNSLIDINNEMQEITGMGARDYAGLGSNGWVVDGYKSATGKPVLANDPHLGTSMPSNWYLAHISAGDLDVIGATIPGLPVIVTGRNRSIAWGITHLRADVQDLFREKLDASGRMVEYEGRMEPVQVINEKFKIKGQPEREKVVRITRHGPIISDVIDTSDIIERNAGQDTQIEPLALSWTALDPHDTTISAYLRLNEAREWKEFTNALSGLVAPSLSFIYADAQNNIGYHAAGFVPIRRGTDGSVPAEGWSTYGEWTGWVGFDNLPHVYNPPEHLIVTANYRPISLGNAYYIGKDWAPPYRTERISRLLQAKEKLSVEDHSEIQGDTISWQAGELLPLLLTLTSAKDDQQNKAIQLLRQWDYSVRGDSAAAAIYEAWLQQLPRLILSDDLSKKRMAYYEDRFDFMCRFLLNTLRDDRSAWCDNKGTPEKEICSDIVNQALDAALKDLKTRMGSDMKDWRWDSLHVAVFPHRPFHGVKLLRWLFSRSIPNGGDRSTVNIGSFNFGNNYEQYVIAGYREIIDLSNDDGGLFIQAIGQSGHFLSTHYDDYLDDWGALRYRGMRMDRATVEQNQASDLRLEPKTPAAP